MLTAVSGHDAKSLLFPELFRMFILYSQYLAFFTAKSSTLL